MKGKFHTEEVVIPILLRKGIVVKEFDYDENNNQIVVKEIGIPLNVQPGLRILGKLDFMRKKGWKVLKLSDMSDNLPRQKKKDEKDKKESFVNNKKKKRIIVKMK